jgi:Flp pilus assembly pilin Flp
VEYGLLLALIAVVAVPAVNRTGDSVKVQLKVAANGIAGDGTFPMDPP